MIDSPGGPFWWPEADQALFQALEGNRRPDIPVARMDCNINSPQFAQRRARTLLALMRCGAPCQP